MKVEFNRWSESLQQSKKSEVLDEKMTNSVKIIGT